MTVKVQKLDLNFLGILGSCIEQYIKGKMTKLEIVKVLDRNLSESERSNWNPKSVFKGYELIDTFLDLKGMSQADLARNTGLSASKINDLISGRVNVTPRIAKKLAAIFDVDHTTFL